jgi:DNA-binding NtrC family response regulator
MLQVEMTDGAKGEEIALLISPLEEDYAILSALFQHHEWTLQVTGSLSSASALLKDERTSLVITERNLADGDWKDVLDAIHILRRRPLLIVISGQADNHLWAQALNLGAYDVLAKPLDQTETLRALTSAWIHHRHASTIGSAHPKQESRLSASPGPM